MTARTQSPFDEQLHRYEVVASWIEDTFSTPPTWEGLSIVDIGCHNGTLCRKFASRGAKVFGIDLYDPLLQEQEKVDWQYIQKDLNNDKLMPFMNESLDVVVALEVLEHIIDTDLFLLELQRVLKPQGSLIISTPNINMLKNRLRVPLGLYPYGLEYHTIIHHVRLYNLAVLRTHLMDSGFDIVRFRGTHLIPQRLLSFKLFHDISEQLARRFPAFSSNIIIQGKKRN